MRKILAIMLVLLLSMSLSACTDSDADSKTASKKTSSVPSTSQRTSSMTDSKTASEINSELAESWPSESERNKPSVPTASIVDNSTVNAAQPQSAAESNGNAPASSGNTAQSKS